MYILIKYLFDFIRNASGENNEIINGLCMNFLGGVAMNKTLSKDREKSKLKKLKNQEAIIH